LQIIFHEISSLFSQNLAPQTPPRSLSPFKLDDCSSPLPKPKVNTNHTPLTPISQMLQPKVNTKNQPPLTPISQLVTIFEIIFY
jgi:hypothetical protein